MCLKNWNEIAELVDKLKDQSKKIVFTNGCFDIIHAGHVQYLSEAKALGDILIIGLNSDSSVKRLKGNDRPVNDQTNRATVIGAMKPVDYVVIFEEDTPFEIIKVVQPDILVKGGDWTENNIVGADIVKSNGGKVISLPYWDGLSTSNTINAMSKSI